MHGLDQIVKMNRQAAKPVETNFERHCSFNGDKHSGVVLHSAKHRNTMYLRPGRGAAKFLKLWWSCKTQAQRDSLVETYFI